MRPAAKGTYVRAAILCAGSIPRAETAQFLQIVMIIAQLNFRARFLSGSLTYPTRFIGLAGERVGLPLLAQLPREEPRMPPRTPSPLIR